MITVTECRDGLLLPVRAQPGAGANGLRGEYRGTLKVAVTQPAEKGRANKAVTQVLCKSLGLRRSQVVLVAGHTSGDKQFLVRDISSAELLQRIASAVRAS